ncbi:S1 family peptidase [Actinomadura opuntiae]|uniref:S1 family peptidase n=1 Tax=Actinomadura sp. OS1-43 TaxID=604315 RepID=UPI00255B166E|nr:S1 family peptidase [Actinomadura sp. OS1-43]MDL4818311.1 S1 family peptidase [Actinomadura sp. OS1-43]
MRRRNAARKRRLRTVAGAGAAVAGAAGLVAGSLYAVQAKDGPQAAKLAGDTRAHAQPRPRAAQSQPRAAALAAKVAARLGERTAGAYVDPAGRPVVTVTNAADASAVRAAGAVPKTMSRTPRALNRVTTALRRSMAGTPGTGWAVDPATSQVVMWTDDSVTGTRMAAVRREAGRMGTAVRMVRFPGRLHTLATLGGDAIFGGGARCSLGFNVQRDGQPFFLTAGHCGNIVQNWTADQEGAEAVGTTVQSDFPGDDFALVQSTADGQSAVDLHDGTAQPITDAADAVVGQQVARSGSTTGVHTGRVTAVGATVNFPEGTVSGMIQTTVCAEPGDSGGPLFSGSTALGLTSGGSGDCQSGGVTFFQPVTEALQTFGAEIP